METAAEDMVTRELRKRYPEYDGIPWEHPAYIQIQAEIADYIDDVWNCEAWETAEGERFLESRPL